MAGGVVSKTWLELVELQLAVEDIVWNIERSTQPSTGLVVGKDGLEGWSMSIKKQLISRSVVEAQPPLRITEQS